MARRSQSSWALSFGLIAWIGLLFCAPLFFASSARADDVSEYGTVIGIVSHSHASLPCFSLSIVYAC